jgi:hypothetical protein
VQSYFAAPRVVRDPDALIEAYGTTDLVMVTAPDGHLLFKRQDATLDAISAAVTEALQ